MASICYIILDSLRWDSFELAQTKNLDRLTTFQSKRFSYASWTQPSHSCLLSGLLPYESEPGVVAAKTYVNDIQFWNTALGGDTEALQTLAPEYALALSAQRLGWNTIGRVSMPVLNPQTAFSRGFNSYELSPNGSSLGAQIESVTFDLKPAKNFVFINAGDTHYPYLMPANKMPRISGIHGAASTQKTDHNRAEYAIPFSKDELKTLHESQILGLERADKHIEQLLDLMPKPLLLVVGSDHGELFGEDNYFGHGPFFHKTLFEVPLTIGIVH